MWKALDLGRGIRCFGHQTPSDITGHSMGDGIIFKRAEHYQSPKNRWNLHFQFDISELLIISLIFYWMNHWHYLYAKCSISSKIFLHPTTLTTDIPWQMFLDSCHQFDNHRCNLISLGKHAHCLDIRFGTHCNWAPHFHSQWTTHYIFPLGKPTR